MVAKALSGKFGLYDCPAGRVEAVEDTIWLTDNDGVAMLDFDENLDETDA